MIKRRLYAENGVPEYWIVDDESKSIEVLTLEGTEYAPFGYSVVSDDGSPDDVGSLVLKGFSCSCAEFFRGELYTHRQRLEGVATDVRMGYSPMSNDGFQPLRTWTSPGKRRFRRRHVSKQKNSTHLSARAASLCFYS